MTEKGLFGNDRLEEAKIQKKKYKDNKRIWCWRDPNGINDDDSDQDGDVHV